MNWPYLVAGFVWGFYAAESRRSNLTRMQSFGLWAGGVIGLTLFLHYVLGV